MDDQLSSALNVAINFNFEKPFLLVLVLEYKYKEIDTLFLFFTPSQLQRSYIRAQQYKEKMDLEKEEDISKRNRWYWY